MSTQTTTHTPGPWTIERADPNNLGIRADNHGYVGLIPVLGVNGRRDTAQRANARLIAAAPELLEALEALMEFADNGTPIHPGALVVNDARAAIAKARGE